MSCYRQSVGSSNSTGSVDTPNTGAGWGDRPPPRERRMAPLPASPFLSKGGELLRCQGTRSGPSTCSSQGSVAGGNKAPDNIFTVSSIKERNEAFCPELTGKQSLARGRTKVFCVQGRSGPWSWAHGWGTAKKQTKTNFYPTGGSEKALCQDPMPARKRFAALGEGQETDPERGLPTPTWGTATVGEAAALRKPHSWDNFSYLGHRGSGSRRAPYTRRQLGVYRWDTGQNTKRRHSS